MDTGALVVVAVVVVAAAVAGRCSGVENDRFNVDVRLEEILSNVVGSLAVAPNL